MSDDYVVEEGGEKDAATAWVNPKPEDCPVIPLGMLGGKVVFALPQGEIRQEVAYRIPGMLRADIYACVAGTAFLGLWRSEEGKIDTVSAGRWLVRQCRERGLWDESRQRRGLGVWIGEGGPVLHAGDAVGVWPFGRDDWRPVAQMLREDRSGPIWQLRPPAPRPGQPATRDETASLRALLDHWSFAGLGPSLSEADVVFGWLGVAILGAWPRFRPHISVSGGAGTGKTTLSRLMQAMCSANAGELLDQFTEAGIRNSLSGEARALFMDEAEPSADGQPGPVERVMEVLRRMSTGEGSAGRKGTKEGGAEATSAVGSGYLASIYPVAVGDAMASRVIEVRLRPLPKAGGATDDALEAAIVLAREMSPRLLARAMRDAKRFRADASAIKAVLGRAGQTRRAADLISAVAAGRRLLLFDEPLADEAAAEAEARLWAPLASDRAEAAAGQNAGQACLARIFSLNSGQHSHDRHLSIGELVMEEVKTSLTRDKVLKSWGIKIEKPWSGPRMGPWMILSTNHPQMQRALAGTSFANWHKVLEHLADLGDEYAPQRVDSAVRFGPHQSRAIAIPLTPWLEEPIAVGGGQEDFNPADWDGQANG